MVVPDLEPFVLQDGTYISGRKAYNDHLRRNNLTNPADYKEQWAKQAEQRAKALTPGAGYDRERRREHLARNYKEFKSYGEFQRHVEKMRKG